MSDGPWLTIIGIGEDGPDGLSGASRAALNHAQVVTGGTRHLSLLPPLDAEIIEWPVPFADGVEQLLGLRGRKVAMLASGDPFWFGAGTVIARALAPGEWRAFPGPSTPSLAAARLGWPLNEMTCFGLHAAPFTRLRPDLAPGARLFATMRDGEAPCALAAWLTEIGFGASTLHVMEALGGPRERIRAATAATFDLGDIAHPTAVAIEAAGDGPALPRAAGRAVEVFDHDGQITKRPVRALTLSALAPRAGERLWDIGGGSGSVAIEWLLAGPSCQAVSVERDPARAARIRANAAALGQDRLEVIEGAAPDALADLAPPDAVFIGGGLSEALLEELFAILPTGVRLVANAVTLESEARLATWRQRKGGALLRIELSEDAAIGTRRGWRAAFPVVQWSVTT